MIRLITKMFKRKKKKVLRGSTTSQEETQSVLTHMNKSKKNTDKETTTDKEANISKIFDIFNLNELNRNEIGK